MAKRSEKRDEAKREYIALKAAGKKVNLKELAEKMGVEYQTIRNWKGADQWEKALPPKKRGGQPGNRNSAGHQNAAGSHAGAPKGNKNAEKDGAYSTVYFDMLTEEERELALAAPLEGKRAIEHEMQILKYREHKILSKIALYEQADEEELYLNSVVDMGEFAMRNQDTAFSRVQKLQEALYKVQGRIGKLADSIRSMEETEKRLELERARVDLMRMRAMGAVEVDTVETDMEDGIDEEGGWEE